MCVGKLCKPCDKVRARRDYWLKRDANVAMKLSYNNANKDKVNAAKRRSYLKNRAAYRRREIARKRGYRIEITAAEWWAVKLKYGNKCLCCGSRKDITKDHVVPIKLGGRDHVSNVQPLCRSCNSRKGATIKDYRCGSV